MASLLGAVFLLGGGGWSCSLVVENKLDDPKAPKDAAVDALPADGHSDGEIDGEIPGPHVVTWWNEKDAEQPPFLICREKVKVQLHDFGSENTPVSVTVKENRQGGESYELSPQPLISADGMIEIELPVGLKSGDIDINFVNGEERASLNTVAARFVFALTPTGNRLHYWPTAEGAVISDQTRREIVVCPTDLNVADFHLHHSGRVALATCLTEATAGGQTVTAFHLPLEQTHINTSRRVAGLKHMCFAHRPVLTGYTACSIGNLDWGLCSISVSDQNVPQLSYTIEVDPDQHLDANYSDARCALSEDESYLLVVVEGIFDNRRAAVFDLLDFADPEWIFQNSPANPLSLEKPGFPTALPNPPAGQMALFIVPDNVSPDHMLYLIDPEEKRVSTQHVTSLCPPNDLVWAPDGTQRALVNLMQASSQGAPNVTVVGITSDEPPLLNVQSINENLYDGVRYEGIWVTKNGSDHLALWNHDDGTAHISLQLFSVTSSLGLSEPVEYKIDLSVYDVVRDPERSTWVFVATDQGVRAYDLDAVEIPSPPPLGGDDDVYRQVFVQPL
jgi:hypothetical protein